MGRRQGDLIGDNLDADIDADGTGGDNDGYSDEEETRAGTDPRNKLSFPGD